VSVELHARLVGVLLALSKDAAGNGRSIERVPAVEAGLYPGEGEERIDERLLLHASRQRTLVGGPERLDCGAVVGERHLGDGPLSGERGAQLVGGVGDDAWAHGHPQISERAVRNRRLRRGNSAPRSASLLSNHSAAG